MDTFRQVFPNRIFVIVIFAALIILVIDCIRRRSKGIVLLTAYSIVILILFFLPPVRNLLGRFMRRGEVYWRVLWLFPYAFIVAAAAVRLISLFPKVLPKLLCGAALAVTILCSGKLIYNPEVFEPASNREKVPEIVTETVSVLCQNSEASGNSYMNLMAPIAILNKTRQCDASIHNAVKRVFFPLKNELAEPVTADVVLTFADQKAYDPETIPEELKTLGANYALMPDSYNAASSMSEAGWKLLYARNEWQIWYEPDVTAASS